MPRRIKGSFGKKEAVLISLVCKNTCMGQGEDLALPGRSNTVKGIISMSVFPSILLTNHRVSADTWSYFCLQTVCCLTASGNNFSHVDCLLCLSLTGNMPVPDLPADSLVLWPGAAHVLLFTSNRHPAMMCLLTSAWCLNSSDN